MDDDIEKLVEMIENYPQQNVYTLETNIGDCTVWFSMN